VNATRALREAFLFREMPESILELVAGAVEELVVPAGEVLISVVDVPDAIYVIRSGTLSMVPAADARPVLFGSGETIGEAQFVDGQPAGVTVLALERTELFVIRSAMLAHALAGHAEAHVEFSRALARLLAARLRRAAGMLPVAHEGDVRP
jgi:CRP-like cAMP-binding protein